MKDQENSNKEDLELVKKTILVWVEEIEHIRR